MLFVIIALAHSVNLKSAPYIDGFPKVIAKKSCCEVENEKNDKIYKWWINKYSFFMYIK